MSNTKIVIDKKDFVELQQALSVKNIEIKTLYTEIPIDQSIELPDDDEIVKHALSVDLRDDNNFSIPDGDFVEGAKWMKQLATQQQIIEQLKVKEKINLRVNEDYRKRLMKYFKDNKDLYGEVDVHIAIAVSDFLLDNLNK